MAKVKLYSEEFYEESTTGDIYRLCLDGTYELVRQGGAALVGAISVNLPTSATNKKFSISGTSAQSQAINSGSALAYPSVDCYISQGANPTALAPVLDGALGDTLLLGGNQYRLNGIVAGNKLAFITTGATGTVEVVPEG